MSNGLRFTQAEFDAMQKRTVGAAKVSDGPASPSAIATPATSKQRLQALGRLKAGQLNKTEQRYADYLDGQKLAGEVLWWRFEAIRLVLAPGTSLTVDFVVLPKSGVLEMVDVKGSKSIVSDDSWAKTKCANAMFPFVFKLVYPKPQKDGGGWEIQEV